MTEFEPSCAEKWVKSHCCRSNMFNEETFAIFIFMVMLGFIELLMTYTMSIAVSKINTCPLGIALFCTNIILEVYKYAGLFSLRMISEVYASYIYVCIELFILFAILVFMMVVLSLKICDHKMPNFYLVCFVNLFANILFSMIRLVKVSRSVEYNQFTPPIPLTRAQIDVVIHNLSLGNDDDDKENFAQ